MNETSGNFTDCQGKYAIVAGRFNHFITDSLISGAVDTLTGHGIAADDIDCIWVPGAFEMPQTAAKIVGSGKYVAVITLGAVIRGATAHFELVAGECARGIAQLNQRQEIPVIFGVLTTETIEQAIERAGAKAGNKGADAALAALQMVSLLKQLG